MLTNIIGDVGSGKTLLATAIALEDKRPVLSNYEIKISRWKMLKPEMLFNPKMPPSLVILDEAYTWLESRRSGTPFPIYMSYILFQSRKRFIDIVLTDQLEGTIETRYRQMLNFRVECENLSEYGFAYYIYKRIRGGFLGPFQNILPLEEAEKIYPFYDTLEIINPIDEELLYKVSEDKVETVDKVDEIVEKMLKKMPPNAWKMGMVEDYCLREKIPHYLAKLVHNRLRTKIAENIYYPTYTKRLKRRESDE